MGHFHCRDCGRSEEHATESAAKGAGWSDVESEGRTGPMAYEYSALCPDCSA